MTNTRPATVEENAVYNAVDRAIRGAKRANGSIHQPIVREPSGSDSGRLRAVTLLELMNANLPLPEPLLAPWLMRQSLAQVHAWRGTGKTWFSLGVAYAVATGGSFLRWSAPEPRRVLFLDGEMPAVRLRERLQAILDADDREIDIDEQMLRFVTPDLLDGPLPDLGNDADQAELDRLIAEIDPALIIVDNISTLVRSGGAENDAESWIPVQAWALRMRRQGRAVLFIHHTGKSGKQRGTSKREDILDAVIALNRPDDPSAGGGAQFIVEFEKSRYVHGDDTKSFEATLVADAQGRPTWAIRDVEDSTLDRVVKLANDGLKMREIAEELGVHKSNVSRAMKRARSMGLLLQSEG